MMPLPLSRLVVLALGASVGVASVLVSLIGTQRASLELESTEQIITTGDTFIVDVRVTSPTPVNVFAGDLTFDPDILQVARIDYNTSIANLWAEEPWYENGAGTLNFAGGTTFPGGFTGDDTLITIAFTAVAPGDTRVHVDNIEILQYDGLGSDAGAPPSIDSLFTITDPAQKPKVVMERQGGGPHVAVLATQSATDLNGDGTQSAADLSIFLVDVASQNKRADFNRDGRVGIRDLSIILNAK